MTREELKYNVLISPNKTVGEILSKCFLRHYQQPYIWAERIGVTCANEYRRSGVISPVNLMYWTKLDQEGYPRICKYVEQINIITNAKEKTFLITEGDSLVIKAIKTSGANYFIQAQHAQKLQEDYYDKIRRIKGIEIFADEILVKEPKAFQEIVQLTKDFVYGKAYSRNAGDKDASCSNQG